MKRGGELSTAIIRRLPDEPDPAGLMAAVMSLIYTAGSPFYGWLHGGPENARRALASLVADTSSEISVERVNVLLEEDSRSLLGMYLALGGDELTACRRADTLSLMKLQPSKEARAALFDRIAEAHPLFPPVAPDEFYLSKLGVVPEARGAGRGRALLDAYIAAGRDAGYSRFRLDVSAANRPAIGLYRSRGFQMASRQQAGGLDYLAMRLG